MWDTLYPFSIRYIFRCWQRFDPASSLAAFVRVCIRVMCVQSRSDAIAPKEATWYSASGRWRLAWHSVSVHDVQVCAEVSSGIVPTFVTTRRSDAKVRFRSKGTVPTLEFTLAPVLYTPRLFFTRRARVFSFVTHSSLVLRFAKRVTLWCRCA